MAAIPAPAAAGADDAGAPFQIDPNRIRHYTDFLDGDVRAREDTKKEERNEEGKEHENEHFRAEIGRGLSELA